MTAPRWGGSVTPGIVYFSLLSQGCVSGAELQSKAQLKL